MPYQDFVAVMPEQQVKLKDITLTVFQTLSGIYPFQDQKYDNPYAGFVFSFYNETSKRCNGSLKFDTYENQLELEYSSPDSDNISISIMWWENDMSILMDRQDYFIANGLFKGEVPGSYYEKELGRSNADLDNEQRNLVQQKLLEAFSPKQN
jgi:hypothetical protein